MGVIHIGKHPQCSTGELIKAMHMDWGHAQRCIEKLVQDGFILKKKNEQDKRSYALCLTDKGENAFVISHQVFSNWDECTLNELSAMEKKQLFTLLEKLLIRKGEYVCIRKDKEFN